LALPKKGKPEIIGADISSTWVLSGKSDGQLSKVSFESIYKRILE
jgi:hypothetical protein